MTCDKHDLNVWLPIPGDVLETLHTAGIVDMTDLLSADFLAPTATLRMLPPLHAWLKEYCHNIAGKQPKDRQKYCQKYCQQNSQQNSQNTAKKTGTQ